MNLFKQIDFRQDLCSGIDNHLVYIFFFLIFEFLRLGNLEKCLKKAFESSKKGQISKMIRTGSKCNSKILVDLVSSKMVAFLFSDDHRCLLLQPPLWKLLFIESFCLLSVYPPEYNFHGIKDLIYVALAVSSVSWSHLLDS